MLKSLRMVIEIDMNIEFLPIQIFICAAADTVRIHTFQEIRVPHQRIELLIRRTQRRQICMYRFASDDAGFIDRILRFKCRNGADSISCIPVGQPFLAAAAFQAALKFPLDEIPSNCVLCQ